MTPTAGTPPQGAPTEAQIAAFGRACQNGIDGFELFCLRAWKILDKDGNLVPFVWNAPQRRLMELVFRECDDFTRQVKVMILKARQMGFSTLCQAFLAWRAFCFKGQNGLTVAHLEEPSGELFGKIETGWEMMPAWFQPVRDNKTKGKKLALGKQHNKALLYVDHAKNKAAGRSQTFQYAHLSEWAFWEDAGTIFTSMTPTLERAKVIFGESTANGLGGHFYDYWIAAEHGPGHPEWNGWHAFFAAWFELPEYSRPREAIDRPLNASERKYRRKYGLTDEQMLWRRDMIAGMGEEAFRQEYPSNPREAFLTSGSPFFPEKVQAAHRETICKPDRTGNFHVPRGETRAHFIDDPHGPVWVWEAPQSGSRYVVSADVASGGGRDYSTIHVLKVGKRLEQVCSYRGKCDPDELATLIVRLAKVYSPGRGVNRFWALVAPERNSFGLHTVSKIVDDHHYPNVYRHRRTDNIDLTESRDYGWLTSTRTRNQSLEYLKELMRDGDLLIRCERTFWEIETFIYEKSPDGRSDDKPVAPRGGFDDMLMALAIGVSVADRVPVGPAVLYRPA